MKTGLSHLETKYPCINYEPGQCHTCRTRYWCMGELTCVYICVPAGYPVEKRLGRMM